MREQGPWGRRLGVGCLLAGWLIAAMPAFAGPADCDGELTEDQKTQRGYCETHVFCGFVFSIFDSCVATKKWLNALPFSKSGSSISNDSVIDAVKNMRSADLSTDSDAPTFSDCLPTGFDRSRCRIYLGIDKAPIKVAPAPYVPPPVSPDTERRGRVLALYKEAENSRARLGSPFGDTVTALNDCMESRQYTYRDKRCAEAQRAVQRCNEFRDDWLKRKATVLADINQAEPGVGEDYTPGTSRLRGLGRQANATEMWNDTVRGLKSLEIGSCPATLPNSNLTPEQALAQWDAEDKGLPPKPLTNPFKTPPTPTPNPQPAGPAGNGQPADPPTPQPAPSSGSGTYGNPGGSNNPASSQTPGSGAGNNAQNDPNSPSSSSHCVPDEALVRRYVEVQHQWVAGKSAFRQTTFEEAMKRFTDAVTRTESSSPETLQSYIDRDAPWVAQNRSSPALHTRMVIAEGDINTQISRCIIAKAQYKASAGRNAQGKPAGNAQNAAGGANNLGANNTSANAGGAGAPGSCKGAYDRQEAEFDAINKRNPKSNSVIPQLQTVMYMLKERMALLDQYCKGQPQYGEYASVQNSYKQSLAACRGMATSDSLCVPRLAW